MARSRDAVDTIKGYYYQFDYFIFQLISLAKEGRKYKTKRGFL